jgi:hypothetical protein
MNIIRTTLITVAALAATVASAIAATITWTPDQNSEMNTFTAYTWGKFFGQFDQPVSLKVGDQLEFSGKFTLAGSTSATNQGFRFGLYNSNGNNGLNIVENNGVGWTGYTIAHGEGPAGTNSGFLRRKNPGNTTWFGDPSTHWLLSPVSTNPSATGGDTAGYLVASTYSIRIKYERTGENELKISVSLTDTANSSKYSFVFSFTDTSANTFTFDSIGLYNGLGNGIALTYSDLGLAVTRAVPESAVTALISGGMLLAICVWTRRRRRM